MPGYCILYNPHLYQDVDPEIFEKHPIIFGDFIKMGAPKQDRLYEEFTDMKKLNNVLTEVHTSLHVHVHVPVNPSSKNQAIGEGSPIPLYNPYTAAFCVHVSCHTCKAATLFNLWYTRMPAYM